VDGGHFRRVADVLSQARWRAHRSQSEGGPWYTVTVSATSRFVAVRSSGGGALGASGRTAAEAKLLPRRRTGARV
jgi:hypothetical protein